jgi:protein transport protein SEC20
MKKFAEQLRSQQSASASALSDCQETIVRLDIDAKRRIQEIRSSPGPLALLNRQTQDVKAILQRVDVLIGQLSEWAQQESNMLERERLLAAAAKHGVAQKLNLSNLRQAQLACMQRLEQSSRGQLFNSVTGDGVREPQGTTGKGAQMTGSMADVTEGLSSLLQQMDTQVKQSQATLETLVGSSQTVNQMESEVATTGSAIQSSGKLLSKYSRRELTDKVLIVLALLLYFGTVAYIVKKRLWGVGTIAEDDSRPGTHSGHSGL